MRIEEVIARALDQALAKAAAQLDEIFAGSIESFEGLLIEKGATEDELAREMALAEQTRVAERARILGLVRSWLNHDGQSLQ